MIYDGLALRTDITEIKYFTQRSIKSTPDYVSRNSGDSNDKNNSDGLTEKETIAIWITLVSFCALLCVCGICIGGCCERSKRDKKDKKKLKLKAKEARSRPITEYEHEKERMLKYNETVTYEPNFDDDLHPKIHIDKSVKITKSRIHPASLIRLNKSEPVYGAEIYTVATPIITPRFDFHSPRKVFNDQLSMDTLTETKEVELTEYKSFKISDIIKSEMNRYKSCDIISKDAIKMNVKPIVNLQNIEDQFYVYKGTYASTTVYIKRFHNINKLFKKIIDKDTLSVKENELKKINIIHDIIVKSCINNQPNISKVMGICPKPFCVITKYLNGGSLYGYLSKHEPSSIEMCILLEKIARGIQYIHKHKICVGIITAKLSTFINILETFLLYICRSILMVKNIYLETFYWVV